MESSTIAVHATSYLTITSVNTKNNLTDLISLPTLTKLCKLSRSDFLGRLLLYFWPTCRIVLLCKSRVVDAVAEFSGLGFDIFCTVRKLPFNRLNSVWNHLLSAFCFYSWGEELPFGGLMHVRTEFTLFECSCGPVLQCWSSPFVHLGLVKEGFISVSSMFTWWNAKERCRFSPAGLSDLESQQPDTEFPTIRCVSMKFCTNCGLRPFAVL